jgi:hypothetical protein
MSDGLGKNPELGPLMPTQSQSRNDRISELNMIFRSLYGRNRDEILTELPLAGLTLIGTGEVWRVEYGNLGKCYQPTEFLPKIKGLMHAILGAHGVNGLLLRERNTDREEWIRELNSALRLSAAEISNDLPRELVAPASAVIMELTALSEIWAAGDDPQPQDFPSALENVRSELEKIIEAVGEAAYQSLAQSFNAFKDESLADHWEECVIGVCGPGQGRRDNIEIAAAMSVMGPHALGDRLLYLENALTIPDGMRFLAAAIVERDLSEAVFGDPYRMWRDLLSDAATKYVGYSFFPELGPRQIKRNPVTD